MKEKLTVIKVGGKIVEEPETLARLLDDIGRIDGLRTLVHGGGRSATAMATRLGIESRMVDGRRITDAETLRVVTMVYGGLLNKTIVAGLQARGQNAIGLTGADMNLITSTRRPITDGIDYGYVGDVRSVDADALNHLIAAGALPVVAPLTHDGHGQLLNTNADTIAGAVAMALARLYRVTLVYCFEKRGVLRSSDDDDVIGHITRADYHELRHEGIVQGGMIPKLDNAFRAIDAGVAEVIITRADDLSGAHGTHIVA